MPTPISTKDVSFFSLCQEAQVDLRRSPAFKRWADGGQAEAPSISRPYQGLITVGVFGLALGLLFYRLGDGSLHDWDEAIYAQVAREMLVSDTWMSLSWNGAPFFHKPPLYFWLTALTYKLIGVSEFAARLWPALFGFGVIALTFVLGVRLHSWVVGAVAALLLLVVDQSYYAHWWNFLSLSRVGMLETGLTFWMITALLLVWEAEQRPRLIPLIGLSVGMAVMTKAWPGLLAAAIPLVYWLLADKRRGGDGAYWAVAALLAGVLILPWHLWQFARHGPPFLHDYVGVNLTSRLFRTFEGNAGSPLHYVDILRRGFSIWGYVWPLAYIGAAWKAIAQGDRRMKLVLVWLTLPLLLFSVAQTKLGWYISMIYPAIALLLALALIELFTARWALGVVAVVMCVCCLRVPVPANGSHDVKQFALQAAPLVLPGESIYLTQEVCPPHTRAFTSNASFSQIESLRPALRFYIDRPLICLEERQIQAGLHPQQAHIISPQASWSRLDHPHARTVFEGHGFVLARWD
jgi:4-amino-4-deoxy-L-arabinose transferase-like glycosyltransferase